MSELWKAITNLPAIAQNVAGGAVFALLVFFGQRVYRWAASRVTTHNRKRRRKFLKEEIARLRISGDKDFAVKGAFISALTLRAFRSAVKAAIWLCLGLLFGAVSPMFGLAGYLGAIYYLLQAQDTLRPVGDDEDADARIEALRAELAELEAKTPKNSSKPTPLRGAA